ncbi:amidase [Nonomuraea aridisoli]|uniref:Amidase n=1 Tax=Nonomuraea aridisoli TaxID=2070368 RepID=A0A2W2DEU4_9ACTN|nr:amidase family protein [Nonomuraea aridisoli]PZG08941.1 amidase [Nonomuraea aridisoli]
MDELFYLPARELAERLRRRELTAVQVLDAYAGRIERLNPSLVAIVAADLGQARRAAAEADRRLARGEEAGPLHGVPMVVKDGHDVAGLRTTLGTELYDRVPDRDGTVAARLRAAGAILLGHSNVPPLLAQYRSENAIFGRSDNPWDSDRTPGGSSGGGAAALAAGLTPIEVGSDYGGSLRLPPHFCGVYGLMATEHRVPATGFWRPLEGRARHTRILMSFGPMARDLGDLELVLRVIAGPDGRDGAVPPVPLRERRRRTLPELRLAAVPELPGASVAASLRAEVERVAARASDAGARVEERLPGVDWDEQRLSGELMGAAIGVFDPDAVLPDAHRGLAWYLRALDRRDRFTAAWHDFFTGYDALILAPGTTTAFRHDSDDDEGQDRQLVFANLAGLPALTAPAGRDEAGLPIGVQIVGPPWSEIRLIEIAAALEEAGILPGFARPPGY